MSVGMYVLQSSCGGLRTTYRDEFSSFTMWVLGLKLMLSHSVVSIFTQWVISSPSKCIWNSWLFSETKILPVSKMHFWSGNVSIYNNIPSSWHHTFSFVYSSVALFLQNAAHLVSPITSWGSNLLFSSCSVCYTLVWFKVKLLGWAGVFHPHHTRSINELSVMISERRQGLRTL